MGAKRWRPGELSARLRGRLLSKAVNGGFAGLATLGRALPQSVPESHGVARIRGLPYLGSGRKAHTLDLYLPLAAKGPLPVVMYVHGGGFQALSKDTHWLMGLAFARRGFLVVNVNYSLAPRHPFPRPLKDVCAAFLWVVERIADYGGDPERLALAAESAGANLVTALSIGACYPRPEAWLRPVWEANVVPRAVVANAGLYQVSDCQRFGGRWRMPAYLGDLLLDVERCYLPGPAGARPGHMALADPLVVLEQGVAPSRPMPAFFLPVGTRDPLMDDTQRMERALTALGVPSQASYFPGELHGFHAFLWRKAARRCWRESFAFLEERLVGDAPAQAAATAEPKGEATGNARVKVMSSSLTERFARFGEGQRSPRGQR